jgi:hypothetical protein
VQVHVPNLIGCSTPTRMEIHGDPGPKVTKMVAGFGAQIFQYSLGIGR